MRFVKPEVFLIAKSVPNHKEVAKWLTHIGCTSEIVAKYSDPNSTKTNAETIIELAGRRCYLSFEPGLNPNVKKIREDIVQYCENIMKAKHGSVLEHVTFTFAIEGVSRVFTGEMNRHRAGVAISEGSMRYIRYDDIPIVDVPSIQGKVWDGVEVSMEVNKSTSRLLIKGIVEAVEAQYKKLVAVWKDTFEGQEFAGKKHITSMLRRIIPMGVATGGIWTFNIRALRHMLAMRASEAAEEEILAVAIMMLHKMQEEEPTFFGDFKPNDKGFYTPVYEKV